jgi:Flp pilus assembly protein TadG
LKVNWEINQTFLSGHKKLAGDSYVERLINNDAKQRGSWGSLIKERAQNMVEFALVLPLMLVLMVGVFEFGRMLFIYASVFTASREAARFGSAAGLHNGIPRYKDCAGIQAAANKVAGLAGIDSIHIAYDSGPDTPDFATCSPSLNIQTEGMRINVEVRALYQPMVPLLNIQNVEIRSKSSRTILTPVFIGVSSVSTLQPPDDYVGSLVMYVANLIDVSNDEGGGQWQPRVEVLVWEFDAGPVSTATVYGKLTLPDSTEANGSCTTDVDGICVINNLPTVSSHATATFRVLTITHGYFKYDSEENYITEIDVEKP